MARGATVVALLVLLAVPARGQAPKNLLFNGDFELDADADGAADGWEFSGDPKGLTARLAIDPGRRGGKCQRLECTAFRRVSGWTHAMLCQLNRVAVRKDYRYTVSFWAKAKDITDLAVGVALQETKTWAQLGFHASFVPTRRWERYEFEFVAARTCAEGTRFQIWFNSTGTLWIDDAAIVESAPLHGTGPRRPALLHKAAGRQNLVPNAGFECGPDGWGSQAGAYYGWGTPMNRLFGEVVEPPAGGTAHGRRCLRIALNAETRPVAYFDYFNMVRHAIEAPLAGNAGFIELERGQSYVLSAYLRAARDGTPARLGVRYFDEGTHWQKVAAGRKWRRHSFRFTARRPACYVLAGPDLRGSGRQSCTLWVDSVQLEKGRTCGEFAARDPVEIGLTTRRRGNIYFEGEKPEAVVSVHVAPRPAGPAGQAEVAVTLETTDFWGRTVGRKELKLTIPPGGTADRSVDLGLTGLGFYRLTAAVNGRRVHNSLRIAVIRRHRGKDSVIGLNHAYGWRHLTETCVNAGIVWARDWSLKWQHVEPAKGRFDFAEADRQIDRALGLGHAVLGLLPFPSANWSSSAPPSVTAAGGYPANRRRMYYAPRDLGEFKTYVSRTVRHYRGRIRWWQVFNEPLYTDYSLPRREGYTPADYVRLVKAFWEAAKAADPECKVLAGPGGWTSGSGRDMQQMLRAGMFKWCDALDLHVYPGLRPPETLERDLMKVEQMMDQAGARKPIWLTEHGYYADDDFLALPPRPGFIKPLPDERVQAEYSVRFNLILLAHGVRKIFYHAGSSCGLNRDHPQSIFFDYGGEPRRILPAVAAFADLFSPAVEFVRDLSAEGRHRALLFRDGRRLILAAWQARPADPARIRARGAVELRDIVGNKIDAGRSDLSSAPVFAVAEGMTQAEFAAAVAVGPPGD